MNWNPRIVENAAICVSGTGRNKEDKTLVTRGKDGRLYVLITIRINGEVKRLLSVEVIPTFDPEDVKKKKGKLHVYVHMDTPDGNCHSVEGTYDR